MLDWFGFFVTFGTAAVILGAVFCIGSCWLPPRSKE